MPVPSDLLEYLADIDGIERIRYVTSHPRYGTPYVTSCIPLYHILYRLRHILYRLRHIPPRHNLFPPYNPIGVEYRRTPQLHQPTLLCYRHPSLSAVYRLTVGPYWQVYEPIGGRSRSKAPEALPGTTAAISLQTRGLVLREGLDGTNVR